MKAEETIQSMYDHYPSLYQTRQECLNHLFCVLGNGYYWKDGELIDYDETEPINLLINGKAHQYNENNNIYKKCKSTINEMSKNNFKRFWYPIYNNAYINNIPSNIKTDWLELVNECKQMLIEDGVKWSNYL